MHQLAFTPCVHLSGFHSGADVCRQVGRSFRQRLLPPLWQPLRHGTPALKHLHAVVLHWPLRQLQYPCPCSPDID